MLRKPGQQDVGAAHQRPASFSRQSSAFMSSPSPMPTAPTGYSTSTVSGAPHTKAPDMFSRNRSNTTTTFRAEQPAMSTPQTSALGAGPSGPGRGGPAGPQRHHQPSLATTSMSVARSNDPAFNVAHVSDEAAEWSRTRGGHGAVAPSGAGASAGRNVSGVSGPGRPSSSLAPNDVLNNPSTAKLSLDSEPFTSHQYQPSSKTSPMQRLRRKVTAQESTAELKPAQVAPPQPAVSAVPSQPMANDPFATPQDISFSREPISASASLSPRGAARGPSSSSQPRGAITRVSPPTKLHDDLAKYDVDFDSHDEDEGNYNEDGVKQYEFEDPWENGAQQNSAFSPSPYDVMGDQQGGMMGRRPTLDERRRAKKERMDMLKRALSEIEEVPSSQNGLSSPVSPQDRDSKQPTPQLGGGSSFEKTDSHNSRQLRGRQVNVLSVSEEDVANASAMALAGNSALTRSEKIREVDIGDLEDDYAQVEMLNVKSPKSDQEESPTSSQVFVGQLGSRNLQRRPTAGTLKAMELPSYEDEAALKKSISGEPSSTTTFDRNVSFRGTGQTPKGLPPRHQNASDSSFLSGFRFGEPAPNAALIEIAETSHIPNQQSRTTPQNDSGSAIQQQQHSRNSFTPFDMANAASITMYPQAMGNHNNQGGNSSRRGSLNPVFDFQQTVKVTTSCVRETHVEDSDVKVRALNTNLSVLYFEREPTSRAVLKRRQRIKMGIMVFLFIAVVAGTIVALKLSNTI